MWQLWKINSKYRVLGAGDKHRWWFDWLQWNLTGCWLVVIVSAAVASYPKKGVVRLFAMCLPTILFCFGTYLLVAEIYRLCGLPAPVRISSVPKGELLRPSIYPLVEDICAVDGGGGTAYRDALNKRYEASHVFRAMLQRLGVIWAIGAEGCAVLCTALVFTLKKDWKAYVAGWCVPWLWTILWTLSTICYVRRELKKERELWGKDRTSNVLLEEQ